MSENLTGIIFVNNKFDDNFNHLVSYLTPNTNIIFKK